MNTYQQILIMFDNFEIIFIGALFPPETAVIGNPPQSSYGLENLEGPIFAWLFGWSVGRHGCDSSDVTLALEDAEVVRRSVGRY